MSQYQYLAYLEGQADFWTGNPPMYLPRSRGVGIWQYLPVTNNGRD